MNPARASTRQREHAHAGEREVAPDLEYRVAIGG